MHSQNKSISTRIFLFILLFIFCLGFVLPALLGEQISTTPLGFFLNHSYSNICHQLSQKSFSIGGTSFLLCARCAGLYLGALMVSFISLFLKEQKIKNLLLLASASLILFLDVLLTTFSFYPYSKIIAFITGSFVGGVIFLY